MRRIRVLNSAHQDLLWGFQFRGFICWPIKSQWTLADIPTHIHLKGATNVDISRALYGRVDAVIMGGRRTFGHSKLAGACMFASVNILAEGISQRYRSAVHFSPNRGVLTVKYIYMFVCV